MNVELKYREETSLSTEMLELQDEAKKHLANYKAENTKRAYRNDWSQFSEWCATNRLQELPADPETLVYYITFLGKTLKASSIKRKMTAISQRHETAGYPSPTKTALVKGVWDGIQRSSGIKEEGKDVLWLDDLRQLFLIGVASGKCGFTTLRGSTSEAVITRNRRSAFGVGCLESNKDKFINITISTHSVNNNIIHM